MDILTRVLDAEPVHEPLDEVVTWLGEGEMSPFQSQE